MSSAIIENKNQAFGSTSHQSNTLIIEISPESISLCEYNSNYHTANFIFNYPLILKANENHVDAVISFFKNSGIHTQKFSYVYINIVNNLYTLCPAQFYDDEKKSLLLEFNCGPLNHMDVLVDEVSSSVKLIYAVNTQLKSCLNQHFPKHQIKHAITILNKLALFSPDLLQSNFIVQLRQSSLEIIHKNESNILFSNIYQVNSNEDVLYYILFAIEHFQLQPNQVLITLIGNFEATSEIIKYLKKYVSQIQLAVGNAAINKSHLIELPNHYFYTLIHRVICE